MRFLKVLPFLIMIIGIIGNLPAIEAATIKQTMEGGMDIEITHPDSVVVGRTFPVSILVVNNGWEEKQDIVFGFSPDEKITPVSDNELRIDRIAASGSFGDSIDFNVFQDATPGPHFLNVDYSHVLLANNEDPQDPFGTNIAIPLQIKEQSKLIIHTITPESIFTNAEFPFTVEVLSEDSDVNDVRIEIIPPTDIEFRGETLHTFSTIEKGIVVPITSRLTTPSEEINTEFKVPFQINVSYKDDIGEEKTDSKTVVLVMRPRTFMELTTDGGIWLGDFFIAPYISLGTIIGIPLGAILSLLIRRRYYTPTKKKKKKTKTK